MEATTGWLLFTLLGVVLGAGVVLAWRVSDAQLHGTPASTAPSGAAGSDLPPGVATVLSVLGSSGLVVDQDDRVLKASAASYALGLVRDGRLCVDELADLVGRVRRDGQIRERELAVPQRGRTLHLDARIAPLSSRLVLVLVDDRTAERRLEAIRRDFVANVSHELKTPVGAIKLLAEAVAEASEDPEAVERFSGRMRTESDRLGRLVQQIIELSRLQGDDPLEEPAVVDVDALISRTLDRHLIDAQAEGVRLSPAGERGLSLIGSADQIELALGNLVSNAVTHSRPGGTVDVGAHVRDDRVELSVTDEGSGIAQDEIDRIFERFYRVDPARARSTGGTGLGLSIVKHVMASHGGEVEVRSTPGRGSTFTLLLPRPATSSPAETATEPGGTR